jgi:hypothetical protein
MGKMRRGMQRDRTWVLVLLLLGDLIAGQQQNQVVEG